MRSQRIAVTIALTFFFCLPVYLISNEDGPLPRHTGGPFPGEQSCAITDCHIGTPVNGGAGRVSITINGLPANQYSYTPGETVPVVVRVEDPTQMRWGFELTARAPDGCAQAGSFATSPSEEPGRVQVFQTNSADNIPECPNNDPLMFPMHMVPKTGAGGASYTFNWTAPAMNIGAVTFAAAGNAANGDRDPGGDRIYTTNAVVQPGAVEPAPKPSISSGGVALATQTPVVPGATPNAIMSVYGQNIAPDGTFEINTQVDSEGNVSTRLANTCIEINGGRAPVFHVFPGQINFQWPANSLGPLADVVVIRACDTPQENRSEPEMTNVAALAPAFFNFTNSNLDGTNPIAALNLDNMPVGPSSLGAGIVPPAPGQIISLFATGLGPTDPPFAAGEVPLLVNPESPTARVTGDVTLTIGGIPVEGAALAYVGVAPCCAGLYQIVITVPADAPDGNLPVIVTIDGVSSPEGPFVAVARP